MAGTVKQAKNRKGSILSLEEHWLRATGRVKRWWGFYSFFGNLKISQWWYVEACVNVIVVILSNSYNNITDVLKKLYIHVNSVGQKARGWKLKKKHGLDRTLYQFHLDTIILMVVMSHIFHITGIQRGEEIRPPHNRGRKFLYFIACLN